MSRKFVANNRGEVTIRIEGDKRVIESNILPDHFHGKFPNKNNPHQISPQRYHFEMPLQPREAQKPVEVAHHVFPVARTITAALLILMGSIMNIEEAGVNGLERLAIFSS